MVFMFASIAIAASVFVFEYFGINGWTIASAIIFIVLGGIPIAKDGHRAFKTGVNTDLTGYVFLVGMAAAIWLSYFQPKNTTQKKSTRIPMSTVSAPKKFTLADAYDHSQLILLGEFAGLKNESKSIYYSFKTGKILLNKFPEKIQISDTLDIFKEEPIVESKSLRPNIGKNYWNIYPQKTLPKKGEQYILFVRYVDIDEDKYFRFVAKDSFETLESLANLESLLKKK